MEVRQRVRGQEPEIQGSEPLVFLCDKWLRTADGDVELRGGKREIIFGPSERAERLLVLLPLTHESLTLSFVSCSVFTGRRNRGEAEAAPTQRAEASTGAHQVQQIIHLLLCWLSRLR